MQLARLMEPRRQRSISAKLRQIVRAIEIERQMSKEQILDLYLAMAPYGGNLEGIRAASIAYFGKEPKRLTLSEAALLVALPQSPENRRLDRYPNAARAARDRVLDRMVEDGVVSDADAGVAKAVPVPRLRKPMPILAPHSADKAMAVGEEHARHRVDAGCAVAANARNAGARPRGRVRREYFRRHSRGRQCKRRRARPRRLAGLFRRPPRGPGRHDARGALAGIDAQAVHLRFGIRGWLCSSGKPDRRPADPLRLLRAGKFRHDVPGHRAGAQSAADVAQRASRRFARPRRRKPVVVAAQAGGGPSGTAQR